MLPVLGQGRAAEEGREIHARVQKRRAKTDPCYDAEVPLAREFSRQGFRIRIEGRIDGIFRQDPPRIEEIKTSFNIYELSRRLGNRLEHPYCLQLLTYGYFWFLGTRAMPKLSFHLVSTRNRDTLDLELDLDLPVYERWLELRLEELVGDARKAEKRAARRRRTAGTFSFPFISPRKGQRELIDTVERGLREKSRMLIQAPTGLGKTAGVLYPILKDAFGRGQSAVYVTPKNSQHSVAEDAVARFQNAGAKIKPLTITAKGRICFKNEPLCNPGYCEYARDYYAKVHENGILDLLARKRKLAARAFRELGRRYEACPFELQLDAAREADVVICDYNYVFAPRSAFGRMTETGIDQDGKPNLVVDEIHNLPSRAMDYYSPALSSAALESMRGSIADLPSRFSGEALGLLDAGIQAIAECGKKSGSKAARIDPPLGPFLEQDARLRAFLSRYLDSDAEIPPGDPVMRLCFYWSEFADALQYAGDPDHPEFFTTYSPGPTGGTVRITCCDASGMLKGCYGEYQHVIGFSATLKPFDYYSALSGLDPQSVTTAEFESPFPRRNRKILIIPQISTKYSERVRNYARIADAVQRITSLRRGNYFGFFPSFEFLEKVSALFQPPPGFCVLRQERDMKAAQVQTVLDHLRESSVPTILFAVQGGMFSEGVDYPGEMAIGAFVIGPPLPTFDLEREQMREYYHRRYKAGFDYAYAIPAMAKAVQAAGRVIRSEADRGLIVLMDGRFALPGYARSMPKGWFETDPNELVSTSILKDVRDFWAGAEERQSDKRVTAEVNGTA